MLDGFVPFPELFMKKYVDKGYWACKTLGEEFDGFADKYADRETLSYKGEQISYHQLGERVNRLALHFIDTGLRTYDRIIFQLSGGTTSIPKVIPRTHNDYSACFRGAAGLLNVGKDSVVGIAISINHNFAMSSPGFLGTLYHGGRMVLIASTKTETAFEAIERERITIMPTPPALLIRWMESDACPSTI